MKALPTPAPELGVREPGPADILLAAGQAPRRGSGVLKALAESKSDHVALWESCSVAATSRLPLHSQGKVKGAVPATVI